MVPAEPARINNRARTIPPWVGVISEGGSRAQGTYLSDEMGRAERYRERAEECLVFSKSIADPMWRAQLVAIAAQWREFAELECEVAGGAQSTTRNAGRVERTKSSQASTRA
jgi:hypothetical protein